MASRDGGREQEGCKVYVGNVEQDGDVRELERAFRHFGPLRQVWVAHNPSGFAFVIFEDPRDAEDAVRELDGKKLCGHHVRVEISHGRSRWGSQRGRGRGGRFVQPERYGRDRDDGQRGRPSYEDRHGERDRRPPPRPMYDDIGGRERDRERGFREDYRSEFNLA